MRDRIQQLKLMRIRIRIRIHNPAAVPRVEKGVGVGTLWLYLGGSSARVGKGVTVMEGGSWADQRGSRWNSSSEMNGMNGDINLQHIITPINPEFKCVSPFRTKELKL
jgi:hypothetical protein